MSWWRPALTALAAAAIGVSCSGPKPEIQKLEILPPKQAGEPYQVRATVLNKNGGEGEASLSIRLRDPKTQETFQKSDEVDLKPHELTHITLAIAAPKRDYEAEAAVVFPPE